MDPTCSLELIFNTNKAIIVGQLSISFLSAVVFDFADINITEAAKEKCTIMFTSRNL